MRRNDLVIAPVAVTPKFVRDNTEQIKNIIVYGIFDKDRDPDLFLFPPDLNMANRFEVLAAMLSARGHFDARIAKILGGNFAGDGRGVELIQKRPLDAIRLAGEQIALARKRQERGQLVASLPAAITSKPPDAPSNQRRRRWFELAVLPVEAMTKLSTV